MLDKYLSPIFHYDSNKEDCHRLCKLKSNCLKIHEKCVSKLPVLACALWNSTTYSPYTKLYTLPQPSEVGTEKKWNLSLANWSCCFLGNTLWPEFPNFFRKITGPFWLLMLYVCHPVICWFDKILNFEVRTFVIVYFQLSKREFDGSTIFYWTNKISIFSVKKKENKYSYYKIWNFVKFANHRMTYKEH